MDKMLSQRILNNPKTLTHLKEHSYWVKDLNRSSNNFKLFEREMKVIYKERPSDKINSAIDNIELVSSLMDTLK